MAGEQRRAGAGSRTNGNGVAVRRSRYRFDETVARLTSAIESKGATVFTVIDHAGEAARVGLAMSPTKVLIFGSPKAGTPLMVAAPSLAIDLPMKILIWQEADRLVWMAYNTAEYLAHRHGLSEAQSASLTVVDVLTAALAQS